ncbi:MAG: RHS repeat protein, partial [Bdellovibrionales bacterium]|nr:RHS repeat protein [Bdellovibrionales bacterium]
MRHCAALIVSFLFFPIFALGQVNPSVLFHIRTNGGQGGPYPGYVEAPASWNTTAGPPEAQDLWHGTSSNGTITLGNSSVISGSAGGTGLTNLEANTQTKIYVDSGGTWTVMADASASVDLNTGNTAIGSFRLDTDGTAVFVSATTTGGAATDSDSYQSVHVIDLGCFPTGGITFPQYSGSTYYELRETTPTGSYLSVSHPYNGSASSGGSAAITVTKGAAAPTPLMFGPLVGGVETNPVTPGDAVTIQNISYDPDDSPSGIALEGLCTADWAVESPDGTITQYVNLPDISFTASQQGPYKVILTVTDNEGDQAQTELNFMSGVARDPEPGDNGDSCMSDQNVHLNSDPASGNINIGFGETYQTETSTPLDSSIDINTQNARASVPLGPMGNATFSYGVSMTEAQDRSGNMRLWLVDSDGAEFDYGDAAASIPQAPPGAYALLKRYTTTPPQIGPTFALYRAQSPSVIEKAGNYSYHFDQNGKLTRIFTPSGTEQVLKYAAGDLITVTDTASNKVITYEYDTPGRIARVVEGAGARVTHLGYTPSGLLTSISLKDGQGVEIRSLDITYNGDDLPDSVTRDGDPLSTVTIDYTDSGDGVWVGNITNPIGCTNYNFHEPPTAPNAVWSTTHTNSQGGVTNYEYDSNSDLIRVTRPTPAGATAPPTYTMTYDGDHNPVTFTDGATTYTMTYNSMGKITLIKDQTSEFVAYTYEPNHIDLNRVENNAGVLYTLSYTDSNNPHYPTVITDALGNAWNYAYNTRGQLTTITPPAPQSPLTITYEENAQSPEYAYMRTVTNGEGDVTTFDSYSPLGDATSITTSPMVGVANTTLYQYDPLSRLETITYPNTQAYSYEYTGKDLSKTTDEMNRDTLYDFCPVCAQVLQIDYQEGKTVSFSVDTDFALDTFVDPNPANTNFVYGAAKELTAITFGDSQSISFTYDNFGRLKTKDLPGVGDFEPGTFTYTPSGRVQDVTYPNTNHNLSYTYYPDGKLHTTTSRLGTVSYTYDGAQRIQTVEYDYSAYSIPVPTVHTLTYTYYPDSSLHTVTWDNSGTQVAVWTYTYDGAGRVESVSSSLGHSATYTYDSEGKIDTRTLGNMCVTEYDYVEERGWVDEIRHLDSLGVPFESYSLSYDGGSNSVGNVTAVTELDGSTVTYTYDNLNRLDSETRGPTTVPFSRSYDYDEAGNITHVDSALYADYDNGNKITTLHNGGSVTYYGSTGFPDVVNGGAGTPCGEFLYSARGELTKQRSCGGANAVSTIYDGHGRRAYSTTVFYLFLGDVVIGEFDRDTGNPLRAYSWGADGLAAQYDFATTVNSYYHFGPQG